MRQTVPEVEWIRRTDPLAERYSSLTGRISLLELVLPRDLTAHREAFVAAWPEGAARDPVFAYDETPADALDELTELIADAAAKQDPWHRLLAEEAEAFRTRYRECAEHDPESLTEATRKENGEPDEALLRDALSLLADPPPAADEKPRMDSAQAASVLTALLSALGLEGWSVELRDNMAASLSVRASEHRIRLRSTFRVDAEHLLRLVAHEIGAHLFRSENARRGARLLCLQLAGHVQTEEGLAVWHEQQVAPGSRPDRRFALRVLAAHAALRGGFVDVVQELLPHTDIRTAFDVTARAKRGLTDTSAPGAFLKDHGYLAGFRHVERHLAAAPQDYPLLMSCKWPLQRLDLARQAGLPWADQLPLRRLDEEFTAQARAEIERHL